MAAVNSVGVVLNGSTGTGAFVGATSPTITLPTINTSLSMPLSPGTSPVPAIQVGTSSLIYNAGILYGLAVSQGNLVDGSGSGIRLNMGTPGTSFQEWRLYQAWSTTIAGGSCNWDQCRGGTSTTYDTMIQSLNNNGACTINIGSASMTSCITFVTGTFNLASGTSYSIPITDASKNIVYATLTNGQLLIGNTGNAPTAATLTAGTGITITNGAGSITVAAKGLGLTWNSVSGTSASMSTLNGYLASNASLVTLSLPTTSAVGDVICVVGYLNGGWQITQAAGQQIFSGASSTTLGATGTFSSAVARASVTLVCVAANTTWVASAVNGAVTLA